MKYMTKEGEFVSEQKERDYPNISEETWKQIDEEISKHPEEELRHGLILKNFGEGGRLFLTIKQMGVETGLIRIEPYNCNQEAEDGLKHLNDVDGWPGGISRLTEEFCSDQVGVIKDGQLVCPNGEVVSEDRVVLGQTIIAHDPLYGPFFVGVPDTRHDDGSFDCVAFGYIDDALDFVNNQRWKDPAVMKEYKKGEEEHVSE